MTRHDGASDSDRRSSASVASSPLRRVKRGASTPFDEPWPITRILFGFARRRRMYSPRRLSDTAQM
jgi:hypothetical protein